MKKEVLSVIPYYGGKSKMAHFIADRLDYRNTELFVTAFGGACRVLLNKNPHQLEIFNEADKCLCELIKALTDEDTANELIWRLNQTEYSEAEFNKAKLVYRIAYAEDDYEKAVYNLKNGLDRIYVKLGYCTEDELVTNRRDILNDIWDSSTKKATIAAYVRDNSSKCKREYGLLTKVDEALRFYTEHYNNAEIIARNEYTSAENKMRLAIAAYIKFSQSRDAIGKNWSPTKFDSTYDYRKRLANLYKCASRLRGVEVQCLGAEVYTGQIIENTQDPNYILFSSYLNEPNCMMFLDPSYIDPADEKKLLEGVRWKDEESIADAVKNKHGRYPKNLGNVYIASFDYRQHEYFLRSICQAKSRIMVCNYDLRLYDEYLTGHGWSRIEYHTTTGVGGKRDNKRKEVLWYNY